MTLKSSAIRKNMEPTIFDLGDRYLKDSDYTEFNPVSSDLLVESDPDSSFVAEFHAGYIFRMLIEYLRDTNTSGNLVVTEECITYTQFDGPERLLNDFVIYTHELTKFEFHSKTGKIIVGINTNDFRNKAKSIRKKFCVTLYKEPGQDFLCMQFYHLYMHLVNMKRNLFSMNLYHFVRSY